MKNSTAVVAIDKQDASNPSDVTTKEEKQKTDKKITERVDKIVRKLDNALTELHKVNTNIEELVNDIATSSNYIEERDERRINELNQVVGATTTILYHLTSRMARKHVGKDVDTLENQKRKSLKK